MSSHVPVLPAATEAATPPTLSVLDVHVDRSSGAATFTVVLDRAVDQPFSVDYDTVNGSAYAGRGGDYLAAAGTLHFTAGQTTQTVTVPLAGTGLQPAEWFGLQLGAVHGPGAQVVKVGDTLGQALLGAQAPAAPSPSLRIADVVAGEGDGYLEFVATLGAPSASPVTFTYAAYAPGQPDQPLAQGDVTIPAGAMQHLIRIPLADDGSVAAARSVVLETSAVSGARAERSIATGTILDDDLPANPVTKALLSVSTVAVDEAAGLVTFALTLDKAVDAPFTVNYGTLDGTAIADPLAGDYQAVVGTAHFAAGELVQYVTVALRDDALAEQAEVFRLHLSTNPAGPGAASVTISTTPGEAWIGRSDLEAVAQPTVTAGSVTVGAEEGYAEFTLTLSAPAAARASAALVLVDPQTKAVVHALGTVEFPPGTTLQTVRVPVGEGTPFAANIAYELAIHADGNLAAGATPATLTVIEGDPTLSAMPIATVRDAAVDEANGTVTFSVVLDRPAASPLTLDWHTEDGSARAGTDYVAANGTVTFGAGDVVQRVTVQLVQDGVAEGAGETFGLVLRQPEGAGPSVKDGTGIAFIADRDGGVPEFSISANTREAIENGWAEFAVTGTSAQAGTEVPYTIGGIEAARVAGGLAGTVTLDADGKALLRVRLLDDMAASPETALSVTLASGASAQVAVADAVPLAGVPEDDRFTLPLHRDDRFDGGTGRDTVIVTGVREQFDLAAFDGGWRMRDAATGVTLTLVDVERVEFSNGAVALDVDGAAGQVYRLYDAAFDRRPDEAGLGYWLAWLDDGATLAGVAAEFTAAAEFGGRFGALDDAAFVTALYGNVLGREPDAAGQAYWLQQLQGGAARASVLVGFSESPEHVAAIVGTAQGGIDFQPFG